MTYSVTEGVNAQADVVVRRSNDLDTLVSVDFATTNLSGTPGLDYLDVATNLTFEVGVVTEVPEAQGAGDGGDCWLSLKTNKRGHLQLARRFCNVIEIAIRLHRNNLLRSDPDTLLIDAFASKSRRNRRKREQDHERERERRVGPQRD